MKKLVLLFIFASLTAFAVEKEQIYGPVKTGDMLWNIAGVVRPDPNLDRYQVMMALLAINPDAFKIPCNINSLQVGKVLKIPNLAEIQQLTVKQALAEFERQKTVWQVFRQFGQAIICAEEENISKTLLDTSIIEPMESMDEQIVSTESEATILSTSALSTNETFNQPTHSIAIPISQISITPMSLDTLIIQDLTTLISQPITTIPVSIIAFTFSLLYLVVLLIIGLLNTLFRPTKHSHEKKPTTPITEDKFVHLATSTNDSAAPVDEVKEKLAIIRSYLADGEEVTLHHLLQEVMKKGNHDQQTEARQLIEINRKMQALNQKYLPGDELPETLSHQTYNNRINLTDNAKMVQDGTTTFLESESYPRPTTRYL